MKGFVFYLFVLIPFSHGGYQARYADVDDPESATLYPGSDEIRPSSCPQCLSRSLLEKVTRLRIKEEILWKLGLKNAPIMNKTSPDYPKHAIHKLIKAAEKLKFEFADMADKPYGFHDSFEDDETFSKDVDDENKLKTDQITITSIPAEKFVPEKFTRLGDLQYFPLTSAKMQRNVWKNMVKATMFIYVPGAPSPTDNHGWLEFHYAVQGENGKPYLMMERVDRFNQKYNRPEWIQVDVSRVVAQWLSNATTNFGYKYTAINNSGTKLDLKPYQISHATYLILDIQESNIDVYTKTQKVERNVKLCTEENNSGETRCCMWPLTIDFMADYGWDFIIHPQKIDVNYCYGKCKLGDSLASSFLAKIPELADITPCCTPQKLQSIMLLYIDDEKNIVLGELPRMKVGKCGCY